MLCPRCGRESPEVTKSCPGCGAPLLIPDDPLPVGLDAELKIDRRGPVKKGPLPAGPRLDDSPLKATPPAKPREPQPPSGVASLKRVLESPFREASAKESSFGSRPSTSDAFQLAAPIEPPELPEDDPLAAPPPTGEADAAFAELLARLRGGAPDPAPKDKADPKPVRPIPAASAPRPPGALSAQRPSGEARRGKPREEEALSTAARANAPLGDLPDAEIDAIEVHLKPAPAARRALSWAVDALTMGVVFGALVGWALLQADPVLSRKTSVDAVYDALVLHGSVATPLVGVLALAFFTYTTLSHALSGATLGKWLLGIRVVGPDGARLSLGRSALRSILSGVSLGLLGLGFLLAFFTRTGRTLHDLVARTWVVEAP